MVRDRMSVTINY